MKDFFPPERLGQKRRCALSMGARYPWHNMVFLITTQNYIKIQKQELCHECQCNSEFPKSEGTNRNISPEALCFQNPTETFLNKPFHGSQFAQSSRASLCSLPVEIIRRAPT